MISTGHGFYFFTILIVTFNYVLGDMAVPSTRIFGGDLARPGEIPYAASFRINNLHHCGAAIISKSHVLTSAFCIYTKKAPYDGLTVVTGSIFLSHGGYSNKISAIAVNPDFLRKIRQGSVAYDLGVITLSAPITFNSNQQPIKLPTRVVRDGEKALFSGWGWTENVKSRSDTLKKVILTAYTAPTCMKKDGAPMNGESRFCTIDKKGKGSCSHDEGSPLVADGKLIGIAASVRFQCAVGRMDIFVYIYEHLEFIMGAVDQETRKQIRPWN